MRCGVSWAPHSFSNFGIRSDTVTHAFYFHTEDVGFAYFSTICSSALLKSFGSFNMLLIVAEASICS